MKKTLLALGLLALPSVTFAAEAVTRPVGGMVYTIPTGSYRAIAIPLSDSASITGAATGIITEVGADYIDNSSAGWSAGELSNASSPYFIRITKGSAEGRTFQITTTANTSTRVNVNNEGTDLTTLGIVTGTDTYEIIPGDTLLSLFGTPGSSGILGGTSASASDKVCIWTGTSWLIFYYNTDRSRWERDSDTAGSPTRDNYVLRPDRGIFFNRVGATDLTFTMTGNVPDVKSSVKLTQPGTTFVSTGFPKDVTLGALSLQTRVPSWTSWNSYSTASANADLLQVWSGTTWLSFYFDSVNNRWQREGDAAQTDRTSYNIPAGRPIMVRLLGSGTGVATIPLPYTLP